MDIPIVDFDAVFAWDSGLPNIEIPDSDLADIVAVLNAAYSAGLTGALDFEYGNAVIREDGYFKVPLALAGGVGGNFFVPDERVIVGLDIEQIRAQPALDGVTAFMRLAGQATNKSVVVTGGCWGLSEPLITYSARTDQFELGLRS